jgi:methyl-accepting chemotaxis protein
MIDCREDGLVGAELDGGSGAGEKSVGFAVVAKLAKKTAAATEEISRKIETIQADARGAVVDQVNTISRTIATVVEEQAATTCEMSRNVAEAAKGAGEVAQNIQGAAQAAQSTSHGATDSPKATKSLAEMSANLRALMGRFKLETGKQSSRSRNGARRVEVEKELAVR